MKTSIIISAVLVGISAIGFAANESNEVTTTSSYDPGKFYGLIVNSNVNIILTQGETNSVRLEGDKNDLKEIKAEVENGALTSAFRLPSPFTFNNIKSLFITPLTKILAEPLISIRFISSTEI